ncbi:collectin-11 [Plakobranchus ocellatus]|uniref:Collectin-11 n=1 Tax=Plakobranchus ocellatus TaxID=259542 RepID=A0AAV4A0T1_9GAST|nr:collectin-11 [Plakobranchus ocellatus]
MNERCKSYGGYLIELNDKDEEKFMQDMVFSANLLSEIVYTGLTDLGLEGHFYHYHTKKPIASDLYWIERQPDNYKGNEHCTHVFIDGIQTAGLNDIDCHRTARYMCELPPQ